MFKKLLIASLAAGALALNAPVALADDPAYDCGFDSNHQASVTGQNYEGVIYGYVAHAGDNPSIRCYITVNGNEVGAEVTASGANAGANAARVSFAASDTDAVAICWDVTTSHGTTSDCAESTHIQIPPQAVLDALNSVLEQIDPTICPVLAGLAGTYGVITVGSDGDISVNGGLVYDCPPYV